MWKLASFLRSLQLDVSDPTMMKSYWDQLPTFRFDSLFVVISIHQPSNTTSLPKISSESSRLLRSGSVCRLFLRPYLVENEMASLTSPNLGRAFLELSTPTEGQSGIVRS